MKSTQNLPQRLKELRNQHHYSQEELAEKLNVTRQAISRWENGKAVPDIDNLLILSELYGIDIDTFFDKDCHSNTEEKILDYQKEVSSVMEILFLSVILVLSSNWYIVGIPITFGVLTWLLYTKRRYKFIYVLAFICFIICIYNLFVLYVHFSNPIGNSFVIPQ